MGPLRDIHLSRRGTLALAAVSLAATLFILLGANPKTDAQLAAEAALAHPATVVEQVQAPAAASAGGGGGGGHNISPPATDAGSGHASAGAGSGGASSGSSGSGGTSGGTGTSGGSGSSGTSGTGGSGGGSGSSTASETTTTATTTTAAPDAGLPKVGHVFLLTLSTRSYHSAFGPHSKAPYLRRLAKRGTVLSGYHALGRNGLADLLALVSGQPPNRDTATGCRVYRAFSAKATVTAAGVARGTGCVYPDGALTVADQATAAGKSWGAYVADMGAANCAVPASSGRLDTPIDGTQAGYDVAHNPFGFFGSLLDAGGCSEYDTDLTNLPKALAKRSRTPDLTYLSGDACVDADPTLAPAAATTGTSTTTTGAAVATTGTASTPATTATAATGTTATATTETATTATTSTAGAAASTSTTATNPPTGSTTTTTTATTPTTATTTTPARLIAPAAYGCPRGQPAGLGAEGAFLETWVPRILDSAAYRADGVLVIAFTGAGGAPHADTGALVISRWTPRGRRLTASYDAYSLLHSIEDMLDLAPLANAARAPAFATLVLSRKR
jgi:hypothetical protein